MTTANTFPAPIGVGVAFTNVGIGVTTPNFVLEPGMWVISVEFDDVTLNTPGTQATLVQVTASVGVAANTTVLTMDRSGYYNYSVPVGALLTFNFQNTNGIRNIRASFPAGRIGPS